MQPTAQTAAVSKTRLWVGRGMIVLSVLFLLFDSVIHIMKIAPVVESFEQLGYPVSLALGIGIPGARLYVVYVIPRTNALVSTQPSPSRLILEG